MSSPPPGWPSDRVLQPREAEHVAVGRVRLDDAVGVQEHRVARRQDGLLLLVVHARHEPERHAARAQLDDAVRGLDVGEVVPGVGEPQAARGRLEDAVEAGHEHLGRHVGAQVLVDALQDDPRIDEALGRGPQHAARGRHDQRRRHALVGHVADDEPDLAVAQRDDVVEVAADLAGRAVVGRDVPARQVGQLAREEVLLDEAGDLELLLEALPRAGLELLLAHELADAQRGRGLRRQAVEQPPVVGGVLLLGQPRAQVQHPDELALADERHGELDAGGAQLAQGGGVELERVEVDGARRALEVGQQRVGGPDLDRGRRRRVRPRGDARRCRRPPALVLRRPAAPEPAADRSHEGGHAAPLVRAGRPGIVTAAGARSP